jgi:hypothetical protein
LARVSRLFGDVIPGGSNWMNAWRIATAGLVVLLCGVFCLAEAPQKQTTVAPQDTKDAMVWKDLRSHYWERSEDEFWEFYHFDKAGTIRRVCVTVGGHCEQFKWTIKLNTAADPMWMDKYYETGNGKDGIYQLGIFKPDGDRLTILWGPKSARRSGPRHRASCRSAPSHLNRARARRRLSCSAL